MGWTEHQSGMNGDGIIAGSVAGIDLSDNVRIPLFVISDSALKMIALLSSVRW